MNSANITIVVARYNENMDWLKTIQWNYVVYNKGEDDIPDWVKNIIKLPNIGRESHTYLRYIVDNYDNLPDYIAFLQGNPFDHSKELIKKISDLNKDCNYFNLSDKVRTCRTYRYRHRNPSRIQLLTAESAKKIFIDNMTSFVYTGGAEFIISKKSILFHTKITYQKIMDLLVDCYSSDEGCSIDKHIKNCKCTKLFSPWVLEMLWQTLFDCEHKTFYD